MSRTLRFAVSLAVLVLPLVPAPTPAGEPEAMVPDSRLGTRVAPLLMLGRPDVRADLRLSPAQEESARRAVGKLYAQALATRNLSGAEAVAARRAIDESQRHWINAELTPEQQGRLDQLDLQWEGPSALATRPAIAQTLGLTTTQRETLKAAVDRREGLRRRQGYRVEDDRALARETLAILTADQRDRWLAMLGDSFVPRVAAAGAAPARRR